ncbi:sugar transferase [Nodosilinea sp. LEGE 07088]|uniref:heterocyst development glycosyltransferase HepC n=1 Tax=Nodosilinea sp. LEGE 07088 TaxID=2777968 RepID=UPI00188095C4|nr:heterocyst development glycosyltransferase HepC [Nodosilinea sp. LEGE 07088]MBE9139427.1 sugar transferase [Nodosilinea sp. LEGE 07088]
MPDSQASAGVVADQTLCRLLWRQGRLWVVPPSTSPYQIALPALAQPEWFQSCLDRSKAEAVVIDPCLGSEVVSFWAQACHQTGKPLYLRLPTMRTLPVKQNAWAWHTKCILERIIGLVLLVLFSPAILLFAIGLNLQDGGPVYQYSWCIGQRGRVFRMAQFRRTSIKTGQTTRLGLWLEFTRLDRLPRLVNLVRGDITLIGTKPWLIDEAVRVPAEFHTCLNALPGIIGPRPMGLNMPTLDIQGICQRERTYIETWTLWRDSRAGLLALAQVFTGSGTN